MPIQTVKVVLIGTFPPGGGGLLQVATVTLTNAQILTLPTVGVQIVPAQGANTIVFPVYAFAILDTSGGGYTGTTNASLMLVYPGGIEGVSGPIHYEGSLAGAQAPIIMVFPIPYLAAASPTYVPGWAPDVIQALRIFNSDATNQPLTVKDNYWGIGNYGGGNAANTLKVTVYYVVVNV